MGLKVQTLLYSVLVYHYVKCLSCPSMLSSSSLIVPNHILIAPPQVSSLCDLKHERDYPFELQCCLLSCIHFTPITSLLCMHICDFPLCHMHHVQLHDLAYSKVCNHCKDLDFVISSIARCNLEQMIILYCFFHHLLQW